MISEGKMSYSFGWWRMSCDLQVHEALPYKDSSVSMCHRLGMKIF